MKYYIALGGVGCCTLLEAERRLSEGTDTRFIYCDTDEDALSRLPGDKVCLIPNFSQGFGGKMEMGRSVVFMDSISGLDRFFDEVGAGFDDEDVELIFVLSSFGGFGAGAVIPLSEYLVGMLRRGWSTGKFHIKIIAFSHEYYAGFFPKNVYEFIRKNTGKLVDDFCAALRRGTPGEEKKLFLVYSKRFNVQLSEILFLADAELETINLLYEYAPELKPARETTGVTQAEAHRRIPPYKGEKPYVFISYAHRDMADALPIIRFLQEKGVRVWYDEGIDPGTEWDDNIASHIKECRAFIALLSAFYLESSNCKDELSYARDLDKKRLLIYLNDKFEMPDGIAMRTNRLQNIHKYKYTEETAFQEKLLEMDGLADCMEKIAEG